MNEQINEITSNSSDNPILDIVNSIQSKLNENSNNSNNLSNTNNINNNSNESNKKDLSGLDISKLIENLTGATTKNNFSTPNINNSNNNSGFNLDMNTIMNFQKILGGINQADPRRDLLTSLKPFLRETRQKNIDTYITLLGVMKAFNIFSNKDRD